MAVVEQRWGYVAHLHRLVFLSQALGLALAILAILAEDILQSGLLYHPLHHFIDKLVLIRDVDLVLLVISDPLQRGYPRVLLILPSALRPCVLRDRNTTGR